MQMRRAQTDCDPSQTVGRPSDALSFVSIPFKCLLCMRASFGTRAEFVSHFRENHVVRVTRQKFKSISFNIT